MESNDDCPIVYRNGQYIVAYEHDDYALYDELDPSCPALERGTLEACIFQADFWSGGPVEDD